jgi:pimeloyl-ACP methyl ester carboxylesterase
MTYTMGKYTLGRALAVPSSTEGLEGMAGAATACGEEGVGAKHVAATTEGLAVGTADAPMIAVGEEVAVTTGGVSVPVRLSWRPPPPPPPSSSLPPLVGNQGDAGSQIVETTSAASSTTTADPAASTVAGIAAGPPLRYEMVRGPLVRWSEEAPAGPHPPTAVLIHGILGSRRNLLSFAKRLAQRFPSWQFLLVDLRCHGQTAGMDRPPAGPNDVVSAAKDVLDVLNHLKIYPHTLLGHSFGGKVAMSMVHQFGRQLPRPVQVWVLDTVPGDVWCEAGDHPRDTITFARTIPMPIATRRALVDALTGAGFTTEGAQWMTTNLTPAPGAANGALTWTFDLAGIVDMYQSYEATDLWPMLETQPNGLKVDFVRAERSAFVWTAADVARMEELGARVHFLPDASHWVHIDNPDGLMEILAPSFGVFDHHA